MKHVSCSGIDLAVCDRGQGPVIVFAHGFPLDHSMWNAQIDRFSKDYRCLAPDLRGFGQSQVIPGRTTMEQMADDIAALLDALRVAGPVTFCGLSMGGYVAWQFFLRHRQRLAKLILCDTRSVADSLEIAKGRRGSAAQVVIEGAQAVWPSMKGRLFAPAILGNRPDLVARFEQVVVKTSPQGIAAALLGIAARPDVTPHLPEIDVPTLVVVGQEDAISPPAEMGEIANSIPNAEFVVISQAGHMAPVENPAAVNEAIGNFLHGTG